MVIAGFDGAGPITSVEVLDLSGDGAGTCSSPADFPVSLYAGAGVKSQDGNPVYCGGGVDFQSYSDQCWEYQVKRKFWQYYCCAVSRVKSVRWNGNSCNQAQNAEKQNSWINTQ